MAPSESDLLTSYLLQPAPLTAIITFDQFRALFPKAVQASPQLRSLFRDLQAQRGATMDTVAASIEIEAQRGAAAMRREVLRQRMEERREEGDAEVEMERAVSYLIFFFFFFFFFKFS
jgi:centromere-localized protein 2